ncbi:hypothetical protein C8R47DRAFT_1318293 [Mycena vitilis]|nr:hypothetical protein C8R47DRAFT_1318293 [Mycena vitilis]
MGSELDSVVEWLQLKDLAIESRSTSGGRGLFAVAPIPPSTPLFTVPAHALVNVRTLQPHYPLGLDAIQLIALHLGLYRFSSSDPLFAPYLDSLPREFDSHPLTRHVHDPAFVSRLPPTVATALARLHARYLHDWKTVRRYLRANSQSLAAVRLDRSQDALEADFLWGWLNVNTRSIYHRLKSDRSHPDNLTLCPILDFANHTVVGPCMIPRLPDSERANAPPIPRLGNPLTLLSPAIPTQPGEQLFLTYGAHPNRKLFLEYGFVVPCAQDDPRAEVDVQDLVEPLFDNSGNEGVAKKELLQESAYWGDWFLDGSPAVSYRLITALRLLHIPLAGSDGALQRWRDTLTGSRDAVSDANEIAWKETVAEICGILIRRARARKMGPDPGAVEILWEEELHVALRVLELK